MITCKELFKIENQLQPKSVWQKLNVWIHILICVHCRNYLRQMKIMKLKFRELFQGKGFESDLETIAKIEKSTIQKLKS